MGWNGTDLVNDFSAELGDTSSAFKSKVLRWVNEGIRDISTSHNWPFLRELGKVILAANTTTHPIILAKPAAPTVALDAAVGSLILGAEYKALITFYESASGVESIAGTPSAALTPNGVLQNILVTDIPVSPSTLVTERRVYVSKAGAAFAYYSTISDNTTLTTNITADTSSVITPPDEHGIYMIDGDFYSTSGIIRGTSLQDLIFSTNGITSTGSPCAWAPVNQEEIRVYPQPSSAKTVDFYYFKLPAKVFGLSTSVPQIPSWLYDDLRNYVKWRGHDFRDRAGQESKKLNYDQGIRITISRKGSPLKRSGRVRSVTPDSDGMGV